MLLSVRIYFIIRENYSFVKKKKKNFFHSYAVRENWKLEARRKEKYNSEDVLRISYFLYYSLI